MSKSTRNSGRKWTSNNVRELRNLAAATHPPA